MVTVANCLPPLSLSCRQTYHLSLVISQQAPSHHRWSQSSPYAHDGSNQRTTNQVTKPTPSVASPVSTHACTQGHAMHYSTTLSTHVACRHTLYVGISPRTVHISALVLCCLAVPHAQCMLHMHMPIHPACSLDITPTPIVGTLGFHLCRAFSMHHKHSNLPFLTKNVLIIGTPLLNASTWVRLPCFDRMPSI